MPLFFVRFESHVYAKLATWRQLQQTPLPWYRIDFTSQDGLSVVMHDVPQEASGFLTPSGLGFDFHIETDSIETAIERCRNAAEMLLELVSLTAQTQAPPLTFVVAYEATPECRERILISELRLGSQRVARQVSAEHLQQMLSKLDAIKTRFKDIKTALEALNRVARAIDWHRKALAEENMLDEFAAYWIGLEALDPLLKEPARIFRTCVECGKPITACNHCGAAIHGAEKTVNPLEGVRFVMEELLHMKRGTFNRVRNLRGAILHGGKSLSAEDVKFLHETMPEFRRGLITAICFFLEVSGEATREISDKQMRRSHLPVVHQRRELVRIPQPPPLEDFERQPRVLCAAYQRSFELEDEDMVSIKDTVTVKHENCEPIPGRQITTKIIIDRYSGVLNPNIEMT